MHIPRMMRMTAKTVVDTAIVAVAIVSSESEFHRACVREMHEHLHDVLAPIRLVARFSLQCLQIREIIRCCRKASFERRAGWEPVICLETAYCQQLIAMRGLSSLH